MSGAIWRPDALEMRRHLNGKVVFDGGDPLVWDNTPDAPISELMGRVRLSTNARELRDLFRLKAAERALRERKKK